MFKVLGVVAAGCAATMCATPAVAAELTPDGPASLMNRWTGPVPTVLTPPAVLTEVRVVVAAGGRAGTVRIQGMSDGRTSPGVQGTFEAPKLGPEATLPAAPGTYTLPAPRVHMGAFYTSRIGLVQETGGHAIVDVKPCAPQTPFADPCQYIWLDGWPGGEPRRRVAHARARHRARPRPRPAWRSHRGSDGPPRRARAHARERSLAPRSHRHERRLARRRSTGAAGVDAPRWALGGRLPRPLPALPDGAARRRRVADRRPALERPARRQRRRERRFRGRGPRPAGQPHRLRLRRVQARRGRAAAGQSGREGPGQR